MNVSTAANGGSGDGSNNSNGNIYIRKKSELSQLMMICAFYGFSFQFGMFIENERSYETLDFYIERFAFFCCSSPLALYKIFTPSIRSDKITRVAAKKYEHHQITIGR